MELRITRGMRKVLDAAEDPAVDPKRLRAIVEAHHLTEQQAVAIFKIHVDAAPGVIKRRAQSLEYLNAATTAAGELEDKRREQEEENNEEEASAF